jgi:predicted MFS family arabinose efflux permease
MVLPLTSRSSPLSHSEVGLFGLVGAAGALAAGGAGDLADRGLGNVTTGLSLVVLLASWWPISHLNTSIPLLLVGVILLDLAVQAVHVTSQSMIVTRHPGARSRLIGGYMVFYSIGSGLGSITSTVTYAHAGWFGVSLLGACVSGMALIVWSLQFALLPEPA